jgi:hypothetical protein
MAMTPVGMAMAGALDWVRNAVALRPGEIPDYLQLIWYFASFATAATALFLIMFLQIPYHRDYDAGGSRTSGRSRAGDFWPSTASAAARCLSRFCSCWGRAMDWRRVSALVAALAGLVGTVVAAVIAATPNAGGFAWAQQNPAALAWTGLGTSLIAAVGGYLIMRSRAKEEYREHWRSSGR